MKKEEILIERFKMFISDIEDYLCDMLTDNIEDLKDDIESCQFDTDTVKMWLKGFEDNKGDK